MESRLPPMSVQLDRDRPNSESPTSQIGQPSSTTVSNRMGPLGTVQPIQMLQQGTTPNALMKGIRQRTQMVRPQRFQRQSQPPTMNLNQRTDSFGELEMFMDDLLRDNTSIGCRKSVTLVNDNAKTKRTSSFQGDEEESRPKPINSSSSLRWREEKEPIDQIPAVSLFEGKCVTIVDDNARRNTSSSRQRKEGGDTTKDPSFKMTTRSIKEDLPSRSCSSSNTLPPISLFDLYQSSEKQNIVLNRERFLERRKPLRSPRHLSSSVLNILREE